MEKLSFKFIKESVFIIVGVFLAGFGLKGFLLSSQFIDGGVTGISMLLSSTLKLPLAVLIPLINLPFIILGYREMGREFAIKSSLAIGGLALVLALVEFPNVTPDLLLTAVFGGFFIGAGIGMAMRGGAVLDGTEVAAVLISRRNSMVGVGDVIMFLNVIIFSAAAYFLGIDVALYSMLTYFAASKTIDFLIYGIEEYKALLIITNQHEEMEKLITKKLNKGVTVIDTDQGFGKDRVKNEDYKIIYTVVTRLEVSQIREEALIIDPEAFIIQHTVDDTHGGFVKARPLH